MTVRQKIKRKNIAIAFDVVLILQQEAPPLLSVATTEYRLSIRYWLVFIMHAYAYLPTLLGRVKRWLACNEEVDQSHIIRESGPMYRN